jgi:hypothetical protein
MVAGEALKFCEQSVVALALSVKTGALITDRVLLSEQPFRVLVRVSE